MVTASHCTDLKWAPDNSLFYQPRRVVVGVENRVGQRIGHESVDPRGWSCDLFFKCRRTDAALISLSDTVAASIGYIVRTRNDNGSREVDPQNPRFRVIGTANPMVNDMVDKIGNTTGWRWGAICRTARPSGAVRIVSTR
jgi:hypothetical protein